MVFRGRIRLFLGKRVLVVNNSKRINKLSKILLIFEQVNVQAFKTMNLKNIYITGFILFSLQGFGSSSSSVIERSYETVPDSLSGYREIAAHLTRDLNSDTEKAKALYIWLSHNIQYNLSQKNSDESYQSVEEIIEEALETKTGVCQHYAELFHAMGQSVGLDTYVITGYTRNKAGEIADLGHAWNGIAIDSKHYLMDVTWAAGYEQNGKYVHQFRDEYFMISPEIMIQSHMPFDPVLQFLNNPLNNKEFISKDFSKLEKAGKFAFNDTIQQEKILSKLKQLELASRRIKANGVQNKLIQKQLNNNLLQIATIKYNTAIDTLNYGVENYNLYVTHKNKQFRNPNLEDSYILELIESAESAAFTANEMLYGLLSPSQELNTLIADVRRKLATIMPDLRKEKTFVEKYLNTWKPFRMMLFVK